MRLIKRGNLEAAASRYPDVEQQIADIVAMFRAAAWQTPDQLVRTSRFPARTIANGRVVFKVKGNAYRLICAVRYADADHDFPGVLLFKFFGTHAEYDKVDATTVEYDD